MTSTTRRCRSCRRCTTSSTALSSSTTGRSFPKAELEKIREWYAEDPNGLVVAPLKSNKDKVTLSAWTAPDASTGTRDRGRGWLATGTKFDKAAFDAFVKEHRYKGPERLLPEQLAPGRLAIHPPGWRNWQTRST